jgi:hypothetical protein
MQEPARTRVAVACTLGRLDKLTACFLLTAAVASAGVACGGHKRDRLSKREWIEQANAICARGDRQIHALGAATTLEQVSRLTARTAQISAGQLRALRGLPSPRLQQTTIEVFLERLAAQGRGVMALSEAAASGDLSMTNRAARALVELGARADRLARALEVHECLSNDG